MIILKIISHILYAVTGHKLKHRRLLIEKPGFEAVSIWIIPGCRDANDEQDLMKTAGLGFQLLVLL